MSKRTHRSTSSHRNPRHRARPRTSRLHELPELPPYLVAILHRVTPEIRSEQELMDLPNHIHGLYATLETQETLLSKAARAMTMLGAQHYMHRVVLGMRKDGSQDYEERCSGCGGGGGVWPCRVLAKAGEIMGRVVG